MVLIAFGLLVGLSFLGSGVRSRNEVKRYQAELRKAGEKLEVSEIVPPAISPEENALDLFNTAMPVLSLNLTDSFSTNSPGAMRMISPGRAMIVSQQPDIRSETGTNTWQELRADLDVRGAGFDFLRELPGKNRLQFDLDYSKGFSLLFPHLTQLKQFALLAEAAVICDLHDKNLDSAATNLHGALVLLRIWDHEPLLISQLVRILMLQIDYVTQWEFLQAKDISESQLALLQSDWEKVELLGAMEAALVGERVLGFMTIEQWRSSNAAPNFFGSGSGASGGSGDLWEDLKDRGREVRGHISFSVWRSSWSFDDQLFLLQTDQILLNAVRQVRTNGFYKDALAVSKRETDALDTGHRTKSRFRLLMQDELMAMFGPESLQRSLDKLLTAEAARELAITSLALKRFELKHHRLPEHLEQLTPEFLSAVPRDPVDGQPLRYRLNSDGSFSLYSIGANAIDDGGSGISGTTSKSLYWQKGLDWVWPQPAKTAEVEAFELLRSSGK